MIQIETLVLGPFQENTYVLHNESGDCIIVDPGCFMAEEEKQVTDLLSRIGLTPTLLLNTHGHVDHISGNKFVYDKFGLKPYIHEDDLPLFNRLEEIAKLYGFSAAPSPDPEGFLTEGQKIPFGDVFLEVIHTPGHSPGSVIFLERKQGFMISGDVLFYESIGRSDLPGGNHDVLMDTIHRKVLTLGDHLEVYPGHGPATSIGHEKMHNPFIR